MVLLLTGSSFPSGGKVRSASAAKQTLKYLFNRTSPIST